jgi:hypothetical protein
LTSPDVPDRSPQPPAFEIVAAETREGALIRDITFGIASDPDPVEAYLVEPEILDARQQRPGLVFAHWFDPEAPNGNRTEFLDEAAGWAGRHRAAAILPQLTFPWAHEPTGSVEDSARVWREVARLRGCLDLVAGRPAVDEARLGVIGHDFGAMHASLLATADGRPAAYVLVAAVPRWADWFLLFWPIAEDRINYLRGMRAVDPIEHVGRAAPARILFQHARCDFFIAPMTGREFARAAGDAAELTAYEAARDMAVPGALSDRTAFLEDALRGG